MKLINAVILILLISATSVIAQEKLTHSVQAGETLYSISRQLKVTVTELQEWNSLESSTLSVGQALVYYKQGSNAIPADQMDVDAPSLITISTPQENVFYTVKSGDNLTVIARKHGMSLRELRDLNNLTSDVLRIGQRLTVRKLKDSVAPSASAFADQNSPQGAFVVYTVNQGETLNKLLTRFSMTEYELQELNPEVSLSSLNKGQKITVLLPPSSSFKNPYESKANLQNLGAVSVSAYATSETGNTTTNGELYDPAQLTAAHTNIALGSVIFIENEKTDKGIYVRINDRITQNGLKLSESAFRILGLGSSSQPLVTIYTES